MVPSRLSKHLSVVGVAVAWLGGFRQLALLLRQVGVCPLHSEGGKAALQGKLRCLNISKIVIAIAA